MPAALAILGCAAGRADRADRARAHPRVPRWRCLEPEDDQGGQRVDLQESVHVEVLQIGEGGDGGERQPPGAADLVGE